MLLTFRAVRFLRATVIKSVLQLLTVKLYVRRVGTSTLSCSITSLNGLKSFRIQYSLSGFYPTSEFLQPFNQEHLCYGSSIVYLVFFRNISEY
jgi:hypothetical protein